MSRLFPLAAVLAACLALSGCNSTLDLAGSSKPASAGGIAVSLVALEGVPPALSPGLDNAIAREAEARALRLVPAGDGARYQVKAYLDAFAARPGETEIAWIVEVSDNGQRRAQRLQGRETIRRSAAEPWSVVDEAVLKRVAAGSMDAVAAWVSGSWGPGSEAAGRRIAEPQDPSEAEAAAAAAVTSFAPLR